MRAIPFGEFLDRVDTQVKTQPRPVQAMVELTYGCNLRCVHCYNPTHEAENELPTGTILGILDELAEQGCLRVGFTGGELLTRRDALEIVRCAKRLGMLINILTNATMITPALADEIRALDPYQVDVSVYGATAETYESVTRVRGSFARFQNGLDLLTERQVPVLLKLVLLTLNAHEHDAMRELARTRGLPYQLSADVHPKVDGSLEPLAYRLSAEQAFEIWRRQSGEAVRQSLMEGAAVGPSTRESCAVADACGFGERVFHCRCGKTSAAVTPHGKLNLCLSIYHPQYDLTQGSVREGWRQLVELVASAGPGPEYECNGCSLTAHCSRGVGDSWLLDGIFDRSCIPYYRELAEHKARFITNSLASGSRLMASGNASLGDFPGAGSPESDDAGSFQRRRTPGEHRRF